MWQWQVADFAATLAACVFMINFIIGIVEQARDARSSFSRVNDHNLCRLCALLHGVNQYILYRLTIRRASFVLHRLRRN